jgi:DNA replication protein DnaC
MNTISPLKKHWLEKSSNIPVRYSGWSKERIIESSGKFPIEIDDWLESIVGGEIIQNPGDLGTTGVGLLFDGGPGEGKTTHAVVAAMEFVRRLPDDASAAAKILHAKPADYGHHFKAIHFLTFPEFLSIKKQSFDAEGEEKREISRVIQGFHGRAKEDWLNVRLLVIDDLGKENGSRYDDASFDELLRSRYDKGLPTIITTNVMLEDWKIQYSEAMGSFAYEAFNRIRVINRDLRKKG